MLLQRQMRHMPASTGVLACSEAHFDTGASVGRRSWNAHPLLCHLISPGSTDHLSASISPSSTIPDTSFQWLRLLLFVFVFHSLTMFGARDDSDSEDNLQSQLHRTSLALNPTQAGPGRKLSAFSFLAISTTISTLLLVANVRNWAIEGSVYAWWLEAIIDNRAAIQSGIQICAAGLGLIHASAVARLIEHATNISIIRGADFTTESLRSRINMSILRWQWSGKIRHFGPVILMCSLGLLSSALWVGAITPVGGTASVIETILVPDYSNTSLIREYPSELSRPTPFAATQKGQFTYAVGIKLLGSLIASGASATTADGSIRKHQKIDNTQYFYEGRSYGVGSAVGLTDGVFADVTSSTSYAYSEVGYSSEVNCIHNRSSLFIIQRFGNRIFPVRGLLPDSVDSPQDSEYFGHSPDSIVAVGVAHSIKSPRRYLSIAAGQGYRSLNASQCTVDFTPKRFDVYVNLRDRSIRVHPRETIDDFDPERNITKTAMRQFELMSNDLTNLYQSVLGGTFLSSASAWNMSNNPDDTVTEDEATLRGLENSITAMSDSMLAAYGAAQLMVGNITQTREVRLEMTTFVIGQTSYIVAVAVLNAIILLVVIAEGVRTKCWAGLSVIDIPDPKWLIEAAFHGGKAASRTKVRSDVGLGLRTVDINRPGTLGYSPIVEKAEDLVKATAYGRQGEVALLLKSSNTA
ncbi:hypothetical protein B0T11DRAFT_280536 [Plectosphaerella cucumerina]|uniref:Uncharacterized protein n=1 Tax=Plectosphaerella cucumerina TaxID=40658 RepID=A0A8K0THM8_9PEZI|nr:hypothetical protein B0T11DRAFT_280536 [Plectosphaerella cucumerina]